jgi:hypothetical protein
VLPSNPGPGAGSSVQHIAQGMEQPLHTGLLPKKSPAHASMSGEWPCSGPQCEPITESTVAHWYRPGGLRA